MFPRSKGDGADAPQQSMQALARSLFRHRCWLPDPMPVVRFAAAITDWPGASDRFHSPGLRSSRAQTGCRRNRFRSKRANSSRLQPQGEACDNRKLVLHLHNARTLAGSSIHTVDESCPPVRCSSGWPARTAKTIDFRACSTHTRLAPGRSTTCDRRRCTRWPLVVDWLYDSSNDFCERSKSRAVTQSYNDFNQAILFIAAERLAA